ncbi:mRNA-decapping enzyme 1A [Chelonus insularis]|uniref:mRNA-decapping enzyme 1A n=1 Tax=Chelonus insularis TaxID=460826 RepID=UPI00158E1EC3|nr:mRNA-decapping enzyme 1A [Chelonus insularis]
MADLIELKMNMAALKRVDPYIKDILETATHVALYTFNAENNEWEKTDIEGALFVYSRNGEPYNNILIMNRLNTNNLMEPVTQKLDLELQEPFLLYRNSKCNIYGIWFYDKDECIRISTMLKQLVKDSEEIRRSNTNLKNKKQINNKSNFSNNVDIFSMLSKAQENFNTSREANGKHDASKSPGTSENVGSFSTPNTTESNRGLFDCTSQSVADFFAKAKVNTVHYKPDHQKSPGNVHAVSENKPILLAHLMSHPAAHTLEHIEKQQRSITPQPAGIPSVVPPTSVPINVNLTKNGTPSSKIKKQIKNTQDSGISSEMLQELERQATKSTVNNNDSKISFLRIQSPMAASLSTLTNHPQNPSMFSTTSGQSATYSSIPTPNKMNKSSELTGTQTSLADTISTLPMRFSSLDMDCKSMESEEILGTRGLTGGILSSIAPALIPPVMFSASSPSEPSNRPLVEPLTKNQLLQAINYLIKNDPDFMIKLHEAYVKSFNEILS